MNVIGYNAKDVTDLTAFKTQLREKFARVKMLLDIYILNTKPKFLGEKIEIDT
jgi:SanA protein